LDIAIESKQQLPPLAQHPRRVHTITDRFSMANTYLICEERIVIVDPGSAPNVRLILEYLSHFLHRSPGDIDLIVLTHLHPDHTSGVEPLRQVCRAPVAASVAARQVVQAQSHEGRVMPGVSHMVGQVLAGTFHHLELFPAEYMRQIQLVDVWLEDVAGLANHPDWRVIASPIYTADSLCLYNPFTCELLCGDTVITSEGGAQIAHERTNRRQLEETLQTLRSLEVHYLYPGHGRPILSKHAITNLRVRW
jgi:hydroxyacylglutathione hydrolase